MSRIDDYNNNRWENVKLLFYNTVALAITWIFALPTINETLILIKATLWKSKYDVIPVITINEIAVLIWAVIWISLLCFLGKNIYSYLCKRIR